jgi:hypothetical protein
MTMNGTITQSGMNITFPAASTLTSGTTYNLNGGTFTTTNSNHENGATMNVNGGTFNAAGDANIDGSLNWAAGSINVGGTVTVGSSGIVTITGDNSATQASINNAGTIIKTAGTGTSSLNATTITNTGVIDIRTGTLDLGGNVSQTAGAISLNGSNITATSITLNGGSLNGVGTVTANLNNNATVNPGFSPGVIAINGDYTQGSAGVLNIEIAGTADDEYDRLIVSGQASLDGTLNITPITPYTDADRAQNGDTFDIITASAGFNGDFATVNTSTTEFSFTNAIEDIRYRLTAVIDEGEDPDTPTDPVDPGTPTDPEDPPPSNGLTQPDVETIIDLQTTDVITLEQQQEELEEKYTDAVVNVLTDSEDAEQALNGAMLICY